MNEFYDMYGTINISVDGDFKLKLQVVDDIRKVLSKYMGEIHLFVDGEEVSTGTRII